MNLSHRIRSIVIFLMMSIPLLAFAQIEYREILVNDSLVYNFESVGNAAQIEEAPANGDYIFNGLSNYPLGITGDNELIYVPDNNFIGQDTIEILYYEDSPSGPTTSYVTLVISVVETYVIANNDYIATNQNTSITIDVVDNDLGPGNLELTDIPLVNYGAAEIVDGKIEFTPEGQYTGRANLTYTVCDGDVCDVATITVFIQDNVTNNDSITVVTLKNQMTKSLFPTANGIQELVAPKHGSVSIFDGGLEYHPNNDYVGLDTFSYAYDLNTTTSIITFHVDVLWADDPNELAVDDRNYVAISDSVEFNVLDNDLNSNLAILTFDPVSDKGGQVIHNGNGNFKYIAPAGSSGLDYFEYTVFVPGTATPEETAKAYLVISNQLPAFGAYDLSTPKNTPVILNYDIQIDNYEFNILSQGQSGELVYYPGDTTIIVNTQEISGRNLLVYYPDSDFVGTDFYEIEYCAGDDCRIVALSQEVKELDNPQSDTLCVADCVWPGDANKDGFVDVKDILPLGYCVGEVGPERIDGDNEWYGQSSEDWGIDVGGFDVKHIDTNGDGYISDLDTAAIRDSYGQYSNITKQTEPANSQIPLFFVPRTPNAGPGDKVIIDIVLGIESLPATDINGITFALNFNQDIVEPGTMFVEYARDNWLSYESTMLSLMYEPYLGRVESGYTRATGLANNGYGIIGQVSFIVVDDLVDGIRIGDTLTQTFRPEAVLAMNGAGEFNSLITQQFNIQISHNISEPFDNDNRNLITYPNPTTGNLNIHVNGNNELEQVIVHSLTGQEVYRTSDELSGKQTSIEFSGLIPNGIYLVTAICDKGVYTSKVELIR